MADRFFKESERKRKAEQEWLHKFRTSFERAFNDIERHQERKLLTWQIILLAFIGGFLLNVLASSVYDFLVSSTSALTFQQIILPTVISLASIGSLIVVFVVLWRQLLNYKPPQPVLSLSIAPEDTSPFLQEAEFRSITEYIERGELKDFRTFGNHFFESLQTWFSHMFNEKVVKEPMTQSEEQDLSAYKEFPTMIREYDVSALSASGVKIGLEVVLFPMVIYSWTYQGDETATRSFSIIFRFRILNPEHKDAKYFLDEYYHVYARRILAISSYCVASAFRKARKLPI
jgi:hypothetical protein